MPDELSFDDDPWDRLHPSGDRHYDGEPLVASGGLCAPLPSVFDPWVPRWRLPDPRFSGWPGRWECNLWVAPRLTRARAFVVRTTREARLRLSVLVHGVPDRDDEDDDW